VSDGLGRTLRRARERREETLAEVEDAIKIRVRHLRAIEEEDWDALPDGSYARAFIRTYAKHLGLDGERLAARYEPAAGGVGPPARPRARRLPSRALTALVVAAVAGAAVALGLMTGGGGGGPSSTSPAPASAGGSGQGLSAPPERREPAGGTVTLSLSTLAEVWVCVLDAAGRPLVEGEVLPEGTREGPFHSGSFRVAFGNGEVAMEIDGKQAQTPASADPLGYAIDSRGRLTPLAEGRRPTCL
jgi:hypothetical protein